jgi:hypothetical protein
VARADRKLNSMSYDFATQQLCPHEIFFEELLLDNYTFDRAYFQSPPSNQSISLYVDGIQVPKSGLYSYAELPLTKVEPYKVQTNLSDLLYIRIGFDAPKLIQLAPGNRITSKDLANDLQNKLPELDVISKDKRVFFKSKNRTYGVAFSFPDPRWTDSTSSLISTSRILGAYSNLGITPGRQVSGKRTLPGWSLILNPYDLNGSNRIILFDEQLKNSMPIIQASYITDSLNCKRCHGSRIEFDYKVVNNTYEIVMNLDLMMQEFDKFVFTKIGSHFKWGWLGSSIVDRIGGKGNTGGVSSNSMITLDITQAFNTYQNIKMQQDKNKPQDVTDAEYPYSLANINMETSPNDPTVAIVTSTIVSRSREPLTFKRLIGNPNSYSLKNDPIQNLHLDPRFNFLPRA